MKNKQNIKYLALNLPCFEIEASIEEAIELGAIQEEALSEEDAINSKYGITDDYIAK